jgi:uncharacterized protein YkwD/uncharacterized membrane protein required for colicin V production
MPFIQSLTAIDWALVVILFFSAIEGYRKGFVEIFSSFIGLVASVYLSFKYHVYIGKLISPYLGLNHNWSTLIGYISIAIATQLVITICSIFIFRRFLSFLLYLRINHIFGIFVAIVNTLLFIILFVNVLLMLPLSGVYKQQLVESILFKYMANISIKFGSDIKIPLEAAIHDTQQFITLKPGSLEKIVIAAKVQNWDLYPDENSEAEMITLINSERIRNGLFELVNSFDLRDIARIRCIDMFDRKYFSYYDPDGHDIAFELKNVSVKYTLVADTIAYAYNTQTVYDGFMAKTETKAIFLNPKFTKIGVGIIDAGIYGKIFTQIFTN